MEYNIKTDILKAALECAGMDHYRYYLMGVCLDSTGYVVAMDGHVLFAARNEELTQLPKSIIIGKDIIKLALSIDKKTETISLIINAQGNFIKNGNTEVKFDAVDGTYPEWKRALPTHYTEKPKSEASFNASLIIKFQKISKIIGSSNTVVDIHNQGKINPAPISFEGRDDCIGVIMPMRHTKSKWKGLPV